MLLEPHCPHDVYGKRAVDPACQRCSGVRRQIVAAGKHRHAGPRRGRALEYEIGQRSARVCGATRSSSKRSTDSIRSPTAGNVQPRPRVDEPSWQLDFGASSTTGACENERRNPGHARAGRPAAASTMRPPRGARTRRAISHLIAPCVAGSPCGAGHTAMLEALEIGAGERCEMRHYPAYIGASRRMTTASPPGR
jgi:hypothetical protein